MLGRHVEDCVFLPCLPVHCLCTHFVISCGTMQSHSAARASLCMNMVQHADRCSMLPPTTERRLCSHLSGLKRPQGGAPGGVNGETYPFHGSEALVTEKFGKNRRASTTARSSRRRAREVRRLLDNVNINSWQELTNSWQKSIEYYPTRSALKEPRRDSKG